MLMQLNTVQWISLPIETRLKLVEIFDLPRSGNTEVENNMVVTDGYTNEDLSNITIEKMQGYLLDTSEQDYFKLFHRVLEVINKIDAASENLPVPEVEIINANQIKQNEQKETEQIKGTNTKGVRNNSRNKKNESKG